MKLKKESGEKNWGQYIQENIVWESTCDKELRSGVHWSDNFCASENLTRLLGYAKKKKSLGLK